ncbi:phage recombination protein Bet [Motilimonas pumila]|uniref:Phage recombination protein Bet n=1 Tax=Motilimonas pumila TaxID=2303987 RepID=A0A418YA12_9GAMM|nr:phage recombination protein Bet [Motilimonas pumila]RJG38777.1 phage recombination protein Bet [Motilimonas pumila]
MDKLMQSVASKFNVDPDKLKETLINSVFKTPMTDEQLVTFLVICDQYNLNPFTKEIHCFTDKKSNVIPVVGVDGWSRIVNEHPKYDGLEFRFSDNWVQYDNAKACPDYVDCLIYRSDRSRPIVIREYLDEVYNETRYPDGNLMVSSWQTHTKRRLRHKAFVQGARIAFGFSGIYDEDEKDQILISQQSQDVSQPCVSESSKATPKLENKEAKSSRDVVEKPLNVVELDESLARISDASSLLIKNVISRAESSQKWDEAETYLQTKLEPNEINSAMEMLEDAKRRAIH